MEKISKIIIHCSDSEWGCSRAIREWHIEKGWKDIGYHFVIQNGYPTFNDFKNKSIFESLVGQIECGRYLDGNDFIDDNETGAHCLGYNRNSVGICLIGKENFNEKQLKACSDLCKELIRKFSLKLTDIIGHYETSSGKEQKKSCPNINMNRFRLSI